MSTVNRYTEAVQRLAHLNHRIPIAVVCAENEMAGQPGAQTYDPIGRSNMTTILWCDRHDRELGDCHRAGDPCTEGITIPVHTDLTGNTAATEDQARKELAEFNRRVVTLENLARYFHDFTHDHINRAPRLANPVESKKAEQENAKPVPLCAVCIKSSKAVEIAGAITVDGQTMLVCTFHRGFHQRHGRLTTPEEEATHQRGKRVTARVSQMDRLRGALLSGKLG